MTSLDALCGQYDGLHAASADFVNGRGIGRRAQACLEGSLASRGLTDAGLDNVAKVDLLDEGRVDVLGGKGMLEGLCTELGSGEGLEGAVDGPGGRALCSNDDSFDGLSGVSTTTTGRNGN